MEGRKIFADESSIDGVVRECQIRRTNGESVDEIVKYVHSEGFSILDCMKIVRRVYEVGLDQAKELVTAHQSWSTETERMSAFNRGLLEALENEVGIEHQYHQSASDNEMR